jgi:hypothetical protein
MNIAPAFAADGLFNQQTMVSQEFKQVVLSPFYSSKVENTVNSTDTLNVNASHAITGNPGAKSSERYSLSNTSGEKYSCSQTAENNVLTSVSEGCTGWDRES